MKNIYSSVEECEKNCYLFAPSISRRNINIISTAVSICDTGKRCVSRIISPQKT